MILQKIQVRNFRSISHLTITPQKLTTLIGKNSCGKSNILRALKFFFTATAKSVDTDDLCKFADEDGTWVECTFGALAETERDDLSKYYQQNGTIRVRRILRQEGDKCITKLHGYIQEPAEEWLKEDFPDYADNNKWAALGITVTDYAELGRSGKITKDTFATFRRVYIERNAARVTFIEKLSDTEFKGRQSTAVASFPNFIFIAAVGDIVSAIYGRQSSLLNEMIGAVIESAKILPSYIAAQESLKSAQNFINPSASRLAKLAEIEEDLAHKLRSWPGTTVSIRTEIADLAKILLEGLILNVNDGHDTDLSQKGDGIQRQILFRVFQLYADYRASRGVFAPADSEPIIDRGPCIIAFEEPELFLHPQAQEQFYDDLLAVAERDQILLATHSNHLIRLDNADGLHIVRRERQNSPSKVLTASANWLQADDRQKLKEVQFITSDASKMFFADKVVITEGFEDFIYIVGTAQKHSKCMDRRVTIVHVGGVGNIPTFQRVLNAFGIPYTVACDKDPGNPATERTLNSIRELITTSVQNGAASTSLDLFDPNIPEVAQGRKPTPPSPKFTVEDAWTFMRTETPHAAFIERVKAIFRI